MINVKSVRHIMFVLMVLSVVTGIYAMYIDLHDPGSIEARKLNDSVNILVIITILISLPISIPKLKGFIAWIKKYDSLSNTIDKNNMLWGAAKPFIHKMALLLVMVFIAAIVLQAWWDISPEMIVRYKSYYTAKPFGYP